METSRITSAIREYKSALQRQSPLLYAALLANGVNSRLAPVPGESHTRIVLALSHPEKAAAPAIIEFARQFGR
ncbi:MAG: hypothetical protein CK533_01590 [Acidobacterium sp.]|nr:MAG: hypothetical protein CK533_01590 [Acidobacterium sp.]